MRRPHALRTDSPASARTRCSSLAGRIARHQQDARAAQRYRILEARLAQPVGARSCPPGRSRRPNSPWPAAANDFRPEIRSHPVGADRLAFRRHLHRGMRARAAPDSVTSIGNRSPLNTWPGKATDSSSRPGFGRPPSGTVSTGIPSCCACQMARAALPAILVAVGDQQQPRHHAGGQRGRAVADRRLQIGPVARRRRRCGAAASCSSGAHRAPAARVARANGITRVQCRPRARSTLSAYSDSVCRSCGETLADVSASTATATLLSYTVIRGCG